MNRRSAGALGGALLPTRLALLEARLLALAGVALGCATCAAWPAMAVVYDDETMEAAVGTARRPHGLAPGAALPPLRAGAGARGAGGLRGRAWARRPAGGRVGMNRLNRRGVGGLGGALLQTRLGFLEERLATLAGGPQGARGCPHPWHTAPRLVDYHRAIAPLCPPELAHLLPSELPEDEGRVCPACGAPRAGAMVVRGVDLGPGRLGLYARSGASEDG